MPADDRAGTFLFLILIDTGFIIKAVKKSPSSEMLNNIPEMKD